MAANRLERIRRVVDDTLRLQPNYGERRCGFVHLYGVSAMCALLAIKRGLDPELCATAGMLHDIWAYKIGDSTGHARLGAIEAERILRESGGYTNDEIAMICEAIANHSKKREVHDDLSELLKDADVLQHYLYNPSLPVQESHPLRLEGLLREIGLRR